MIWSNEALQATAAQRGSGIVLNYVLNAAALQLTLAYPKQSPHYVEPLAGRGLSKTEKAGVGFWKRFPKPRVARSISIVDPSPLSILILNPIGIS